MIFSDINLGQGQSRSTLVPWNLYGEKKRKVVILQELLQTLFSNLQQMATVTKGK